jgi:hypothetical protein
MQTGKKLGAAVLALGSLVAGGLAACGGDAFTAASADASGATDSPVQDVIPPTEAAVDAAADSSTGEAAAADAPHAEVGPPDAPTPVEASTFDAVNDQVTATPKHVFVTSQASTGNLGGLAGADAICQAGANQASLAGTYMAWLSSTLASPASRMTHSTGPYELPNGVRVANDWQGLTSGMLLAPIDVTEKGGSPPRLSTFCGLTNVSPTWTSTATNGTLATTLAATCADWTTSGTSTGAILGEVGATDQNWTNWCGSQGAGATICGAFASLYCIEQ